MSTSARPTSRALRGAAFALALTATACDSEAPANDTDTSDAAALDAGDAAADTIADAAADVDPGVTAPDRVARFPAALPFTVERAESVGEAPSTEAVDAFTQRMLSFYADTDLWEWTRSISHGVADENPWDEPSYLFWWQGVTVTKADGRVTFVHEGGADNMMSHHGRVFGPLAGAYLTLAAGEPNAADDAQAALLRELLIGYIHGVSATFTGGIYADEDPVVDTIMARAIFHRNHDWEVPNRGPAAVDYELERAELIQRRHDTLHNPSNPTWGDIWVRNKRSKDDFPWVYRMQAHLAQILWTVEDEAVREAALTLYDQLQAFSQDVLDHGYIIRAKDAEGAPYIPYLDEGRGVVDDFASMVEFEAFLPNAECNAKLPIALIATGEPQDNDCGDGQFSDYEEVGLARFYGHTWMQWNFHISALTTALLYGQNDHAEALLIGLGERFDALRVRDDQISQDPRFASDIAQTLVLAATYGMPLTGEEAQRVIAEFERSADHYEAWPYWNLWDDDVPDGDYPYLPGLSHENAERDQIHIEEMANLFEYCASPVRALNGAQFMDCAAFIERARGR